MSRSTLNPNGVAVAILSLAAGDVTVPAPDEAR